MHCRRVNSVQTNSTPQLVVKAPLPAAGGVDALNMHVNSIATRTKKEKALYCSPKPPQLICWLNAQTFGQLAGHADCVHARNIAELSSAERNVNQRAHMRVDTVLF